MAGILKSIEALLTIEVLEKCSGTDKMDYVLYLGRSLAPHIAASSDTSTYTIEVQCLSGGGVL